jgi:Fe-S cluster assembly protein SufD
MIKTAAETGLANLFAITKSLLPGDAASREDAFRRFAERGLPHRRVEDWKYTDLRAFLREAAPFAGKPSEAEIASALALDGPFASIDAIEVVIVNGHLVRIASGLPEGLEIAPMREALASGHPLLARIGAVGHAHDNAAYALNAAFMSDGAVIRVAAGATIERPIHLRFVNTGSTPFATATRVLLHVEVGASVTVLETHAGPERHRLPAQRRRGDRGRRPFQGRPHAPQRGGHRRARPLHAHGAARREGRLRHLQPRGRHPGLASSGLCRLRGR